MVIGEARALKGEVEREVQKITAEAVRNAELHSQGENVTVFISFGRDFAVKIVDDGVGLPFGSEDGAKVGHYGLQNMRERAAVLGGKLSIKSQRDHGTTVSLTVPPFTAYADGRFLLRRAQSFKVRHFLSGH